MVDKLVEQVQHDHSMRKLECKKLPKRRRGKRERLVPNTALISYAANAKALLITVEPKLDTIVERFRE